MTGDIETNGKGGVMVMFPCPGNAVQIEFKPESARELALLLWKYADKAQAEIKAVDHEHEHELATASPSNGGHEEKEGAR